MEENCTQQNIASQIEQIRTMFKSKSIIKHLTDNEYRFNHRNTTHNHMIALLIEQKDENTNGIINILFEIADKVKIFTDRNECIDYLTDLEEDEKVYLIILQFIDRQFIQLVESIVQIQYIYIVKSENKNEIFPIRPKGKVKGVFTSMGLILDRLRIDTLRPATDRISYSIISCTMTGFQDRNQLDHSFMYSQLIKEIILEIEFNENSMKQFVDFCLDLYEGNHQQCEKIKNFQMQYKIHSSLWWYSTETFVYSLLNKALRTQDTTIIVKMAFFLRDLLDEIN